MKLSHFLLLGVVVLGLAIFGLSRACSHDDGDDVPPPSQVANRPTQPPPQPQPQQPALEQPRPAGSGDQPQPPAASGTLAARPYDAEVLAWSQRSISGDKMKDATKGKSYKLNVYKDAGKTTVNRAKLDLDRDDKFDEKYTFETTKITLQRAPSDDEQYTETFHWNGTGWTKAAP